MHSGFPSVMRYNARQLSKSVGNDLNHSRGGAVKDCKMSQSPGQNSMSYENIGHARESVFESMRLMLIPEYPWMRARELEVLQSQWFLGENTDVFLDLDATKLGGVSQLR